MIRSSTVFLITTILALQAQAQTPVPTAPPSNPPKPTPIPSIVPAVPVAQTTVPTIVLDAFDSVTQWTTTPADGVEISVRPDANGIHGKAMRVDFDFHGHGGYAVIHRQLNLTLPANYEISFAIKGAAPTNTLELKMIDSTGENVWWSNNPNFQFPKDWQTVTRKKRQISFAWGPTADKDLKRFSAIEIAITAGSGGKGSIWLDDLVLTPLEPDTRFYPFPRVTASSQSSGYDIGRVMDTDQSSAWRSAPLRVTPTAADATAAGAVPPGAETIDIDFQRRREFGGLVIGWEQGRRANSYEVQGSADGQKWQTLYTVNRSSAAPLTQTAASTKTVALSPLFRDYLYMPESDARFVRIVLKSPENKNGYGIRDIAIKPLEWGASENDFFMAVAKDAPRGSYPRPFLSEQSYWTVIGVDRDSAEALINEEGMIEVGRGQFSIEPFLYSDGKLVTWSDAATSVASNPEALPVPQVTWSTKDLDLTINAFAAGASDSSVLYARYRITNTSKRAKRLTLYLAIRPFQVNPPWQFLNLPGGVARVDTISLQASSARITGNKFVRSLNSPSGFGAVTFDEGNIVDWLHAGRLPAPITVTDHTGHASAAFSYQLELGARATSSPIDIAVPLHGGDPNLTLLPGQGEQLVSAQLEKTRTAWREKLGRVTITLPASASRYTETMRTQLADILINRDGPAIQP
ncbi:MAG: discoidin domain-containing protein, partial [Gemmatimonadota bacterium]|nr:discoidin domain-containing protein [Gemmatimonadota bacterium]